MIKRRDTSVSSVCIRVYRVWSERPSVFWKRRQPVMICSFLIVNKRWIFPTDNKLSWQRVWRNKHLQSHQVLIWSGAVHWRKPSSGLIFKLLWFFFAPGCQPDWRSDPADKLMRGTRGEHLFHWWQKHIITQQPSLMQTYKWSTLCPQTSACTVPTSKFKRLLTHRDITHY